MQAQGQVQALVRRRHHQLRRRHQRRHRCERCQQLPRLEAQHVPLQEQPQAQMGVQRVQVQVQSL